MLKSRIIPCLLIHNKGLVKTVKFKEPKYVGDPINAVKTFNEKEVDELIISDIDASVLKREPNFDLIKKFAEESPAAQIVAEATGSKTIQLFHEHIFIKDPGTDKETPWHQDMPYYCVDGNDTGSFWIH